MDLHEAASHGDVAAVAQALAAGQSVDTREASRGCTPLMAAVVAPQPHLALVRFLLERGADVHARSWTPDTVPPASRDAIDPAFLEFQFTGDTALTLAAAAGNVGIVTALLDAGSDIHATNAHGYDALINAAYASTSTDRQPTLVALLLSRSADPTSVRPTVRRRSRSPHMPRSSTPSRDSSLPALARPSCGGQR